MGVGVFISPLFSESIYAISSASGPTLRDIALVAGLIGFAAGTAVMRSVAVRSERRIVPPRARSLVIGVTREAARQLNVLRSHRQTCEWVGFVNTERSGGFRCTDETGERYYENLEAVIDHHEIDEVFEVGPTAGVDSTQLRDACAVRGLTFRTVVHSPLGPAGRYTARKVGAGEFVLSFETAPQTRAPLAIKRATDIVGALCGLLICAITYAVFATRIKRETEGSVIFKQMRVGRNGRHFNLFKFRTMHVTAEKRLAELLDKNEMNGHVFKMKDDPRITPLGGVMRRRYLDELPQFWNVLRGEMSLVGTRPPTCSEVKSYSAHHRRRLSMKPGMTGLWQVSGNGRVTDFEEIVRLDTSYIDNWSLWLDWQIIGRSFLKLFYGGGW